MNKEDSMHAARMLHDKAVTKEIEDQLQVMVMAVLGNKKLEISNCVNGNKFDQYVYCKSPTKADCPGRNKKYKATIDNYHMFYSDSRIGLYCKILERVVGDKIYFPFTTLGGGNNE